MLRKKMGLAFAGMAALAFAIAAPSARAARAARHDAASARADGRKPDVKRYVLTGTVLSIDVPNHSVDVDGDDVPGYMSAMEMPYSVPDEAALKALVLGDIIRADIVVHGDDAHLENIKVTGHAKPKSQ